ncbi:MAG: IS30 family transposase, partial [Desulfocapsa sp.]|nr:IS30 family transposase [Desulfocapsa sp.]
MDIDERPSEANDRERFGDWEADTIIGKNHKGVIVTLDDRKSKLRLAAPLTAKKAKYVKDAIVSLLFPVKEFIKTITFAIAKSSHFMRRLQLISIVQPILPNLTIL